MFMYTHIYIYGKCMNTKIYPRCDPSNPCKASHNVANKESFVSILIHSRPHLLLIGQIYVFLQDYSAVLKNFPAILSI